MTNEPQEMDRTSLLLIVTEQAGQVVEVLACDGIDSVLERIADRVTHPEEDCAVSLDVLSEAWAAHVADGGVSREFVFSRPKGIVGGRLRFAIFPTASVWVADVMA